MRRLMPEHRALVALARRSGPPPEEGLLREADWPLLGELAIVNNLAPLALDGLGRHGLLSSGDRVGRPPTQVVERWRRDLFFGMALAGVQQRAFDELARAIRARGPGVVALKGLVFSRALYPGPEYRPMADLDILVRAEDMPAIGTVLVSLGYEHRMPAERFATQEEMFEQRYEKPGGPFKVLIEVHTSLGQPARYRVDEDGLWSRAVPAAQYGIADWGPEILALSPEDTLLHLCLHQSNHMFDELDLRSVLDVHELVSRRPLDWGIVVSRAHAWGVATALHLTLRTARSLAGTSVPGEVLRLSRPSGAVLAWLELFIDADGLGAYKYESHPRWLKRAMVGFPLMDRFSDRVRFARYYAGLRVRDLRRGKRQGPPPR